METIELLKKMISIPSFSGNEERVADLMVATWVEHGYSAERSGNNVWVKSRNFDPVKPTITLSGSMEFPALGTPIVKAEASQACLDDITVEVRGYLDSTNMWGPQYINIQSGNSGGQVEVSGLTPSGSVTIDKVNNTEIQPVNTDNATYTW